ncbi:MAG: ferric reductase-like transmembrane domain-containing protein, partial [Alphaproteobacteria bacterium]|nr:ferric reductase-like transmembrane domain-containing protein [Alphaproteobacteria bacterium]
LGFLVLVLALNPLKSVFPSSLILKKINLYRQEFGVACFCYAMVHFLCFALKRGSFSAVLPYVLHPALIPVFFVAMPIFFVLALTSTKYALKRMGFVWWKRLHRKVYYAEGAVFLHMILVGEKLWAFLLFTPLICLQIFRVLRQRKLKKLKQSV